MDSLKIVSESSMLTWITFIPLIGMTAVLLVPRTNMALVKGVSAIATFIPLVLATMVYFGEFQTGVTGYQLVQDFSWIQVGTFDVRYTVGIDGLSLPLVWLTTLLLFLAIPASETVPRVSKAYYALLLLL